jgi:hypothetical protein
MNTKLGKITNAQFGFIRDYPFLMGLILDFKMDGGSYGVGCGGKYTINISKECKWNNNERSNAIVKQWDNIAELLKAAKVENVEELKGIPIEITLNNNIFHDFRILTEVI